MFKSNKTAKEPVKVSSKLSSDIDSIVNAFTTMISNLNKKAEEANEAKIKKEEEMAILAKECDNLAAVSARALKLSNNISKIFDENGGTSDC